MELWGRIIEIEIPPSAIHFLLRIEGRGLNTKGEYGTCIPSENANPRKTPNKLIEMTTSKLAAPMISVGMPANK